MLALFASILALLVLISLPATASAASIKVVIVVGPVEGSTAKYISNARTLAPLGAQLRRQRDRDLQPAGDLVQGQDRPPPARTCFIYLGHGNGSPSPYPYSTTTKNGVGLNRLAGHGNSNVKYYGSAYIKLITMAPNSVVILNHLCYSAGNSEPGRAAPSPSVARQRIDNYGSSFLRTGARAVFAEPKGNAGYILSGLFNELEVDA